VLEGRGDVTADLRRPEALLHLRAELREAFVDATPFLWVESLVDRAAPALDLAAIRARGEFSAEVLVRAEGLAADPAELAAFGAARDAPLHTGQVGRQVSELPADAEAEILSEALARVLDRLEAAENA